MIIGSYVGVLVLGFSLINFLSAGFLIRFIRVKASGGSKILLKVRSATDHYFKVAQFSERTLRYTARGQKEKKLIPIPKENFLYRSMKVWCADVDEEKNCFITPEGKELETYDAEKYEQLVARALYKPTLMDKNEKIILILLIAIILGVVILFFFVKGIDEKVFAMQEQLAAIKDITSDSMGVLG
jgi:hypothetical protein